MELIKERFWELVELNKMLRAQPYVHVDVECEVGQFEPLRIITRASPPSPAIQQAAARMGISAECADKMLLTHRTHDWYWTDRYWLRALGATAA
ncbi:hypothetical protein [Chitinilyticum litopenaei]|uniref:hypothetical protein n=1 Tax=Chitinilyticum litopenaei TaxID=1121276 RepID=UPI00048CCCC5|nr:hypothetical protein [Chitinilyticum litopenaei]